MIFSFVACGDTPAPTYTVTYVDGINDAEITVPSDTNQYHAGDTVTVKFTGIGNRTNYTFSGWSDGTTTYTSSGTTSFAMGTANVTLTAQWQWNYIGTKAPSVAKEVGDIVFSDGSATPYTANLTLTTAQQNAAIAIIFYKGTDCSDDNPATERTLGVGLVHGSNKSWSSSYAKAYNTNITTIQSDNCKDGSQSLEKIAQTLGDNDDTTANNAATLYLAFYFCKNYASQSGSHLSELAENSEYRTGWYLPTKTELQKVYDKKDDINSASDKCGGSNFVNGAFWSSSQHASYNNDAYELWFETGEWHDNVKNYGRSVCCIRAFN